MQMHLTTNSARAPALWPHKLTNLPFHTAHAQNIPPTPAPPKSRQILRPRNFEPSPNELRPGFLSTIHESPSRWVRNPSASSKPLCASGRDSETRLSLRYGISAPGREFVVVAVSLSPFSKEMGRPKLRGDASLVDAPI